MPSFDAISEAPISHAEDGAGSSGVSSTGSLSFPGIRLGGIGRVAPVATASGEWTLPGITGSGTAAILIQSQGLFVLPGLGAYGEAFYVQNFRGSGQLSLPGLTISGVGDNDPPTTANGAWSLPAITASGTSAQLSPAAGPSTRQSEITIDLRVFGEYFDELDGKLNDMFSWEASGTRFSGSAGDGALAGQGNRFWYQMNFSLHDGQYIDIDLYSYLTFDGGKGFGRDQLGLGVVMNEVTMLYVHNKNPNGYLTLGGATTAPWTSLFTELITIAPDKRVLAYTRNVDGWAITQAASQYLRLTSLGTCIFDICVEGRYSP